MAPYWIISHLLITCSILLMAGILTDNSLASPQTPDASGDVIPIYTVTYELQYVSYQLPTVHNSFTDWSKTCGEYYATTFLQVFVNARQFLQRLCRDNVASHINVNIYSVARVEPKLNYTVKLNTFLNLTSSESSVMDMTQRLRFLPACASYLTGTLTDATVIERSLRNLNITITTIPEHRGCAAAHLEPESFVMIEQEWLCPHHYHYRPGSYLCTPGSGPHSSTVDPDTHVPSGALDNDVIDHVTTPEYDVTSEESPDSGVVTYRTDPRGSSVYDITDRTSGSTHDAVQPTYNSPTSQYVHKVTSQSVSITDLGHGDPQVTSPDSHSHVTDVPSVREDNLKGMWDIRLVHPEGRLTVAEGGPEVNLSFWVMANLTSVCASYTDCHVTVELDFVDPSPNIPTCRRSGVGIPQLVLGRPSWGTRPHGLYSSIQLPWGMTNLVHNSLPLKARVDGKYDGLQRQHISLALRRSTAEPTGNVFMNAYKIPIDIIDRDRKATCQSINDPHIITFDGMEYNNYYEGEFILYKHKTLPFKVTTVYQKCGPHVLASCNCAVAVQSGDDVIVIERCLRRKKWFRRISGSEESVNRMRVDMYVNGNLTRGTRVLQEADGKKYNIHLPHGTYIKVMVSRMLINTWIVPSPSDLNQTQGLCGTYDGDVENEIHFQNGSTSGKKTKEKRTRARPADFILDWRVDLLGAESLLRGVNVTSVDGGAGPGIRYCLSDQILHRKDCGYGLDVDTCDTFHVISIRVRDIAISAGKNKFQQVINITSLWRDITEELIGQARRRQKPDSTRMRRDTYPNYVIKRDNYDEEPIIISKKFKPPKHKWKPGWNEVHAKGHCERYLRENYTLGQLCAQVPGVNMDAEVRTCMEDIQIVGDASWAESARDAMKEQCLEEIQRNVSLPTNLTTTIHNAMCPQDCNKRGLCTQGVCECSHGYTGADCSLAVHKPPYLSEMPHYGLCDTRHSKCDAVIVYGKDFINNDNLTCHLQECQVTATTYIPGDKVISIKANFINFGAVECLLPVVTSYLIYISNNGINKSAPLLFVPYDPMCQECSTNDTFCVRKKTSCIIDGRCYEEGEHSYTNECLVCAPSDTEQPQWATDPQCTASRGDFKMKDWVIAVVAAVGGSLIGILVGFLLYKCCCKSRRKHLSGARPSIDSRDAADQSPFEDSMLHRNRDLAAFASDRFTDLHHHQHPQFEEKLFFNDGRGVENGVDSTTYF